MSCEDEYEVGENVTHLFSFPEDGAGMVLSLRFSRAEVQELFDWTHDGMLVQAAKAAVLEAARAKGIER